MNMDSMTTKELRELRGRIDLMIARKQAEARSTLRDKFKELAASAGLSLDEIVHSKPARKKANGKASTKAMRDSKTGAVWRGTGRHPANFDKRRAVPVS